MIDLAGRCPRCGEGRLFKGFLDLQPACDRCGLDFSDLEQGDGAAVLIILFSGFLVCGLALWVEVAYSPPYWMHAVLWLPLVLLTTVGLLRPLKAFITRQHFRYRTQEGEDASKTPPPAN